MPLTAGTRLGPYEIVAPLGAGGMGEVYRARDSRLGRDLAIKVLPAEVAGDPERRLRFEQEARAASALNHPNVVHVYDVGTAGSTTFIAMELVEGRALRDVLAEGPLPAKRMLDYALQITDGLARAHEAAIVHRDLKPDNIMISKDGHVRILDFGLAKLVDPGEGDALERSTSPQITRAGMVLGTLAYMSPEQAAGRPVDFRSDQFSLGTILYEMASGRRPFHRETGAETLAAILRETPPSLAPLAPQLPAPLRWIIEERCLAKDREERYASTRDLLRELLALRGHFSEALPSSVPASAATPPRRRSVIAALLALFTGLGVGAWVGPRLGTSPRAGLPTFRRLTFRRGEITNARFAPDGHTIVYSARLGKQAVETFSTRTDSPSPESRALGLPQSSLLAISSNGEMALSLGNRPLVGWESIGTLGRASLAGGAPRELVEDVEEADWAPDGQSLAVVRDLGGRRRLEFPIDKVLYETAGYISQIRFSPKGDLIAFMDHPVRGDNSGAVAVVDLAGRKRTLSGEFSASSGLAWPPSGEEIWVGAGRGTLVLALWAVTLSGRERLVWEQSGAVALHDIGRDGRALMSRVDLGRQVAGLAPGATVEQDLSWLDWSFPADLSEDGQTLLIDEEGEGAPMSYATYLRKTDGSPAVRLGEGEAQALALDGKSVLVLSGKTLLLVPIGAGAPKALPIGELTCQSTEFLPDGQRILLAASEPQRAGRLYLLDVSGGSPRAVTPEGVSILRGTGRRISPDGRFVAATGPDRRIRLYAIDGGEPRDVPGLTSDEEVVRWTADGRGLYVRGVGIPARIDILDLATGRRALWRELAPADPAGVRSVFPVLISRDGKSYVYSYRRWTEDLYLAEGLR